MTPLASPSNPVTSLSLRYAKAEAFVQAQRRAAIFSRYPLFSKKRSGPVATRTPALRRTTSAN